MLMRAKFVVPVGGVTKVGDTTENISMMAVTSKPFDKDGNSEDNSFARWTPSGKLEISITNPDLIGQIKEGQVYYGQEKGAISVIMPLRDRNGEAMAATRVVMQPFAGQTEQNAIARALPIVKEMQNRLQSLEDLVE